MTSKLRIRLLAAAGVLTAAACAHAETSSATPSYTAAQAVDGGRVYQLACGTCHLADLSGHADAPPLAGPAFARRWTGRPIGELTGFMREHMPRNLPGQLNDRSYLAAVAYLLARNGVPAGEAPLTLAATWPIPIESP